MSTSHADTSTVAIPWFNNIWLNDNSAEAAPSTPCRRQRPTSQSASSSLHTISTMSAIDRISVCSVPSSARQCSAQELGCATSSSASYDQLSTQQKSIPEPGRDFALQMRLLQMKSVGQGHSNKALIRLAMRADRAKTTGSINRHRMTIQENGTTAADIYRTS